MNEKFSLRQYVRLPKRVPSNKLCIFRHLATFAVCIELNGRQFLVVVKFSSSSFSLSYSLPSIHPSSVSTLTFNILRRSLNVKEKWNEFIFAAMIRCENMAQRKRAGLQGRLTLGVRHLRHRQLVS